MHSSDTSVVTGTCVAGGSVDPREPLALLFAALGLRSDSEDRAVYWRGRALCADEDPELWFPVGTSGTATARAVLAKNICRRCTVRRSCLERAEEIGALDGIWGGLDADERRRLRARTRSGTAR